MAQKVLSMTSYLQHDRSICFLILPSVHLMDLSGAAQAFYEASNIGTSAYNVGYSGTQKQVISEQGLALSELTSLEKTMLKHGDLIFVPGIDFKTFKEGK